MKKYDREMLANFSNLHASYKNDCMEKQAADNKDLPAPLLDVLDKLYHFRHTWNSGGHIRCFLSFDILRKNEASIKALYAALKAVANTYPECADALKFSNKAVVKTFDALTSAHNSLRYGVMSDVFENQLNNVEHTRERLNKDIVGLFTLVDQTYGTHYAPSQELLTAETTYNEQTKDALLTKHANRVKEVDNRVTTTERWAHVDHPQPTDLFMSDFPLFMDIDVDNAQIFISKERIGAMSQSIHKWQSPAFQATSVHLRVDQVGHMNISDDARNALFDMLHTRHTMHSHVHNKIFANPEKELPTVALLIEAVNCLKQNDTGLVDREGNLIALQCDVEGLIEEMKDNARDIIAQGFREPYLTDAINKHFQLVSELDEGIIDFFKEIDKAYNSSLAPTKKGRGTQKHLDSVMRAQLGYAVKAEHGILMYRQDEQRQAGDER